MALKRFDRPNNPLSSSPKFHRLWNTIVLLFSFRSLITSLLRYTLTFLKEGAVQEVMFWSDVRSCSGEKNEELMIIFVQGSANFTALTKSRNKTQLIREIARPFVVNILRISISDPLTASCSLGRSSDARSLRNFSVRSERTRIVGLGGAKARGAWKPKSYTRGFVIEW